MYLRHSLISVESFDHDQPHVHDVSASDVVHASDAEVLCQVLARDDEARAANLRADVLFD